jgi:hypothetical protein
MPFQKIKDLNVEYGLISFDREGVERTDDPNGGTFSKVLLEKAIAEKPTNIFLFCHGWKGDMVAAIDQYDRWIGAMAKLSSDQAKMGAGFKPMWIGLHWPSQPWGEEGQRPASFGVGGATGAAASMKESLEAAVAHFGGTEAVRKPLEVIFRADEEEAGAVEVPPHVLQAYKDLASAIGFSAGKGDDAAPDGDGAALDPQAALEAANAANEAAAASEDSFGIGDEFSGLVAGLKSGLRQLSFWTMKKRGRTVGEQGMHRFIASLQTSTDAGIHLMGHSFGCVVVSSILGGPNGNTPLPKPVESVALVQGAVSHWSWADKIMDTEAKGYFNHILVSKAVKGPIIATISARDLAVGVIYPAAVGLVGDVAFGDVSLPKYGGFGAFGVQGTSIAERIEMLDQNGVYAFKPGRIYNIMSEKFIKKMDGASGAHSDIDGPEVAHAIWQAALAASAKDKATHA